MIITRLTDLATVWFAPPAAHRSPQAWRRRRAPGAVSAAAVDVGAQASSICLCIARMRNSPTVVMTMNNTVESAALTA